MRLKYTGTPTLDLSSMGLGSIATNAIFDINRLAYESLSSFTALSNFTDVTPYPATVPPFAPVSYESGLAANRPAAGLAGRFYFATDTNGSTGQLYEDTGTTWVAIGAGTSILEAQLDPATANHLNAARMAKATYDFSVNGGAQGSIVLTGAALPVNAVVVAGFMEVLTAILGTGASVAIQLTAANDIVSAAAISGAPWSTTGRKAIVPLWSDMTKAVKVVSTAKTPTAVVTTADLTAGKFNLFLVYYVTD